MTAPSSIVSLVNLQTDSTNGSPVEESAPLRPLFSLADEQMTQGTGDVCEGDRSSSIITTEEDEFGMDIEDKELGKDSDLLNEPKTSVEIHRDPSRIWLSSSIYDQDFVDYLSQHPVTKNSMIIIDGMKSSRSSNVQESSSTEPAANDNVTGKLS